MTEKPVFIERRVVPVMPSAREIAAASILETLYREWCNREVNSPCDLLEDLVLSINALQIFTPAQISAWATEDNERQ